MPENINDHISHNLKLLRKEKGLTLDELADLSNVSKSMLSEIERGGTNPTILVLWKIAEGMKIPLTRLMTEAGPGFTLVRSLDQPLMAETGDYRISTIFSYSEHSKTEILSLQIAPHGRVGNSGHVNGVEEVILVTRGNVRLVLDAGSFDLQTGDAIRFDGSRPHEFINDQEVVVGLTNILYYN